MFIPKSYVDLYVNRPHMRMDFIWLELVEDLKKVLETPELKELHIHAKELLKFKDEIAVAESKNGKHHWCEYFRIIREKMFENKEEKKIFNRTFTDQYTPYILEFKEEMAFNVFNYLFDRIERLEKEIGKWKTSANNSNSSKSSTPTLIIELKNS